MGNPRVRASSGEAQRSYLFLSMILLVWNTLATGRLAFQPVLPMQLPFTASPANRPVPVPVGSDTVAESRPRIESLTLRQEYLLGKRIDINTAFMEEINELPGVSDAMAEAIVAERDRVGRFKSPEDLLRVKGIKEKRLKIILPFLVKMENN